MKKLTSLLLCLLWLSLASNAKAETNMLEDPRLLEAAVAIELTAEQRQVFQQHLSDYLTKLATAPDFGYDAQYQLPADCLRVVEVYDTKLPWVVEGRVLLSSESTPVYIRYVKREEDTAARPKTGKTP